MNRNAPADRRPVLRVTRPTCPRCGCPRLPSYRSTSVDEETTVRYSRCSGCGLRVLLIIESRSFQNLETTSANPGSMEGKGATVNLETLGRAAERLSCDPKLLQTGLRANEATPVLVLNGLRYYRSADLERAVVWVREMENRCQPS